MHAIRRAGAAPGAAKPAASNRMPDHRYMYPKVVPVAGKQPAGGASVHNFVAHKVRISLQPSREAGAASKTSASL
jgi:hypothetical protein